MRDRECKKVTNNLVLLLSVAFVCYTAEGQEQIQDVESDVWYTNIGLDPITDEPVSVISKKSTSGKVDLVIKCTNNQKLSLYIDFHSFIGPGRMEFVWRVPPYEAESLNTFTISSDRRTIVANSPKPILQRIYTRRPRTLVVRISPYYGSPLTEIFEIPGQPETTSALNSIVDACNVGVIR